MISGEFQKSTQRISELVERVSALPESEARSSALELLQSLMDLHGAAVSRMLEVISESGDAGNSLLSKLGSDPLICGLLVLYGIHPVSLEERVSGAIEKLRAQLGKQGRTLELVSIREGVVRLKVYTESRGSRSSADKAKLLIQQTILEAAPEVIEIIIEGLNSADFVPIDMIQPASEEETYEESAA
jgi:hypothetical protein